MSGLETDLTDCIHLMKTYLLKSYEKPIQTKENPSRGIADNTLLCLLYLSVDISEIQINYRGLK